MELSRKRKKELKKLRSAASDLWDDQKDILEQASRVVKDAGHHASDLGHEAADSARDRVSDVLPAVSSAMASALALLEVAKDPRVRAAIAKVGKTGTDVGANVGARFGVKQEKQAGPGRYILIGLGLVAVAGVAYAAWQTLRADDELWVSSDDDLEEAPAN